MLFTKEKNSQRTTPQKGTKQQKVKRGIVGGGLLAVAFLSIGIGWLTTSDKIQGKPNDGNPIVIDKEDPELKYPLPYDGGSIIEQELANQPKFSEYVQDDQFSLSLSKQEMNGKTIQTTAFSSEIRNLFKQGFETIHGNYIFLQEFTTNPYGTGYLAINSAKIVLVSGSGEILDSIWVYKQPESNTVATGLSSVTNTAFFKQDENEFLVMYTILGSAINTTILRDEGDKIGIISPHESINLSGVNSYVQELQNHSVTEGDNSIYTSGVIRTSSTDKEYYTVLKHSDGTILDQYKFEASPGSNNQNSIYHYSLIQSNSLLQRGNTYYGIERASLVNGTRYTFSKWELDSETKIAKNTVLYQGAYNDFIGYQDRLIEENSVTLQHRTTKVVNDGTLFYDNFIHYNLQTNEETSVYTVRDSAANLNFSKLGDNLIQFTGTIYKYIDDFEKWKREPGFVVGLMDKNFKILSLDTIGLKFPDIIGNINLTPIKSSKTNKMVYFGSITDREMQFVDRTIGRQFPGDAELPATGWLTQSKSPAKGNALVSFLETKDDYAPVIKAEKDLILDQTDPDWLDKTKLENMLLTGNKAGDKTHASAVKVYDNFDFNYSLDPKDESWLDTRINRNPLKLDQPIDWKELGLDLTKTGPQRVTYFVTDSQLQTTSTSRWINVFGPNTVKTDDFALRAENFAISVDQVADMTGLTAKQKSNFQLWKLFDDHEVIDDATNERSQVKVDETELKAIQKVKERYEAARAASANPDYESYEEILKPYPLTMSYEYDRGGKKQTLKHTVTVFITNETTHVDKANKKVIYGFNFRYPLKKAAQLTDEQLASLSHAIVWDYNAVWGTDGGHSTVTSNRQAPYQSGVNEPKTGVNNARTPRKDYQLQLTDPNGGSTNSLVKVELYEEPVTLHVRQIVLAPNEEMVIPETGYYRWNNTTNAKVGVNFTVNAISSSGTKETEVPYETYTLPVSFDNYFYHTEAVIPEYYKDAGYKLSKTKDAQGALTQGAVYVDYTGDNNEYWLTFYIQPDFVNQAAPGFYGWNYGQTGTYHVK